MKVPYSYLDKQFEHPNEIFKDLEKLVEIASKEIGEHLGTTYTKLELGNVKMLTENSNSNGSTGSNL